MNPDKTAVGQRLLHLVQLSVKGVCTRGGHTLDLPLIRSKIENLLARNAIKALSVPADEHLICVTIQGGQRTGENVVQLLILRRLEQITQRAHGIAVIHIIRVACYEHELKSGVGLVERAGGFHAVHRLHFNIKMLQSAMEAKGIHFVHPDTNMQSNVEFLVDSLRIKQVVMNLLNNACKFTPPGGTVELRIRNLQHDGHHAVDEVTIQDTGCGMSRKFLENGLYQPFSQEQNAYSGSLHGTGLGLAIVKEIVERMDGSIRVSSELGKGTTFTVTLQYDYRVLTDQTSAPKAAGDITMLSGRRVLLVDDHPLNRRIAQKLLEKVCIRVEQAENGSEAVDCFTASDANHYDAILMDIRMPVMGGLEAAKAIRALTRPDAQAVPIIAMTANAFDEDIQKSKDAGMNAHLAKPVSPQLLYEVLAQEIQARKD
jgi:CheY-like chemotaxis protein